MEDFIPKVILHDKYYLKEKLGVGYTAKVYLAIEIQTKKQYAIKILKQECKTNELPKEFMQEIDMLKRINHINVIRIIDANIGYIKKHQKCSQKKYYLVFEYAENNTLYEYIYRTQKGFGEYYGRYIFKQIVDGLEACHNEGVVHRDLKTENILIDTEWRAKLSDFGYARLLMGDFGNKCLKTIVGTREYAPPEMLKQQLYSGVPLDIFTLGVCLFIIVNGKLPFRCADANDPFYNLIINKENDNYWSLLVSKLHINISIELRDLITRMLSFVPKERPSIKEIYNHPWMQMKIAMYNEIQLEYQNRAKYIFTILSIQSQKYNINNTDNGNGGKVYRSEFSTFANCVIEDYYENNNLNKILLKDIKPIPLMDDLVTYYKKKDNWSIEINKKKLKFIAKFESEEEEEDDKEEEGDQSIIDDSNQLSFSIEIKLKKDSNDYYLEMMRRTGSRDAFMLCFTELTEELKK